MSIPNPPKYVSLENFYQSSRHPDIKTFQAAMIHWLDAPLTITGVYDDQTESLVKEYAAQATDEMGIILAVSQNGVWLPNENFTRMLELTLRDAV